MACEHPVRAGEHHGEYPGLEFAQEKLVSSQERWWLRRPWSRDDATRQNGDREGRVICVRQDAGGREGKKTSSTAILKLNFCSRAANRIRWGKTVSGIKGGVGGLGWY